MKKAVLSICILLCFVFMGIMFDFSNTPYKQQDIKPLLAQYMHLNAYSLPHVQFHYYGTLVTSTMPYDFIEFFIRKASHVTEYTILTLLFLITFSCTSISLRKAVPIAMILSFLYACLDEWHQSFVPDRTGHIIDVVTFDSFGIIIGTLLFGIGRSIYTRKKRKQLSIEKRQSVAE